MLIKCKNGMSVDNWYDRPNRSWATQLKNEAGDQIGDATYSAHKGQAKAVVALTVKENGGKVVCKWIMKKRIIVTNNQGYWGAGDTIEEAVKNAKGLDHCLSVVFFCFLMNKSAKCWIDGMGSFCWSGKVYYQKLYLKNGKVILEKPEKVKKVKKENVK